jgi:hypothetical protein
LSVNAVALKTINLEESYSSKRRILTLPASAAASYELNHELISGLPSTTELSST